MNDDIGESYNTQLIFKAVLLMSSPASSYYLFWSKWRQSSRLYWWLSLQGLKPDIERHWVGDILTILSTRPVKLQQKTYLIVHTYLQMQVLLTTGSIDWLENILGLGGWY